MKIRPNLMNSFAAGLLISAGVCGSVYFSNDDKDQTDEMAVKSPTKEEMKKSLTDDGFVVLTEKEWDEQLALAKKEATAKNKETTKEQTDVSKKKDSDKVIYRTVINVAPGMTSMEVGEALVEGKIIKNARSFFNAVEKRGLENDLKPGIFTLDNTMSLNEVIKTIFKK